MTASDLKQNLHEILATLAEAARSAGRSPSEITLMGVSKTHPYDSILALNEAGLSLFGENRVQEGESKLPPKEGRPARINLIGHLQSNKARKALSLFDRIDSVDSLRLAQRLERMLKAPYPILLEVNTSGEASKHGFEDEAALFAALDEIAGFEHLQVEGLMTLGPLGGDEMATRKAFSALRTTFERVKERYDLPHFRELSMGMSGDYRWAIAEGSTCVRIGTALFGQREVR